MPSGATSSGRCANRGGVNAEALENQQVLERVRQVILPADDVADAQVSVIHARGKVVRGHPVRPQQRKVFHFVGELLLLTVNAVNKAQRPSLVGWPRGTR